MTITQNQIMNIHQDYKNVTPGYASAKTFSNQEHLGSNKYSMVQTGAIIEMIKSNSDLDVYHYHEAGVKKPERAGFQNHAVRMRSKSLIALSEEVVPEIVIINSYDKSKAFKAYLGFFRGVCANGLIVGDKIAGFSQRHVNFNYNALLQFIADFPSLANVGMEQIGFLKSKQLSGAAQLQLAREALLLKSGRSEEDMVEAKDYDRRLLDYQVGRATVPQRRGDVGNDAFTAMNRIQEFVIKGRRGTKVRATSQIDKSVKLNRFVWDRAVELAA